MKGKIISLYKKYEEIINYIIVGGLTTAISLGVKYALLFTIFDAKNPLELQLSVIISWICAVIFAYFANRKYVFKSKSKSILKEMITFFSARVATLVMEALILWFFITYLKLNSNTYVIIWTIVTQIVILIGNYILSKFFVFNKDKTSKIDKNVLFDIIVFGIILGICFLFPYTHDDWAWGTSIGTERLTTLFRDYNGRWIGNLLVLVLTRFRVLRALTISTTLWLIVHFIKKILDDDFGVKYIFVLLCLLMPTAMIAQSITWTSGFANYVIPILIIFIMMYYNLELFKNNAKPKQINFVVTLILGFVASLFVEHMTIYNVLFAFVLCIYSYFKNRKIDLSKSMYLVGSIAGSLLMFSNSAYGLIASSEDTYRTMELSGNIIIRAFNTYFDEFYKLFIFDNKILNILLCIVFLKLISNNIKQKNKYSLYSCATVFVLMLVYYLFSIASNVCLFTSSNHMALFEGTLSILYILSMFITIMLCTVKKDRLRLAFELVSVCLMAAPLLIVTPIGPRCFLPIYIMFVLIGCDVYMIAFKKDEHLVKYVKLIIIFIVLFFLSVYFRIYSVDEKRIEYINNNLNAQELVLPNLPFKEFMQGPNPKRDTFKERFKLFYGINEDVKIKFVHYEKWAKEVNE